MSFADMEEGVGLSDPVTAQHRRDMLDLINRLRNTGLATFVRTSTRLIKLLIHILVCKKTSTSQRLLSSATKVLGSHLLSSPFLE